MKNQVVIQSIENLRTNTETFDDTKQRIIDDKHTLDIIFTRVQNVFNDVRSLKKYIKKL